MKIVCVSDTHLAEPELPEGDVVVHGGDLTYRGTLEEMTSALDWLGSWVNDYKAVIFIAGNHDFLAEREPEVVRKMAIDRGLIYLQDSDYVVDGLKFWGTPWSNEFGPWAFMTNDHEQAYIYKDIPNDVDVLISHGPPEGTFDKVVRDPQSNVGSKALRDRVEEIKPRLHVFGHIHEGYASAIVDGRLVVNASHMNVFYDPVNEPIVVELEGL